MFERTSYTDQLTFFQKIRSLDIWLILSVITLGVIGVAAMYSSDGGQFSYHTKSHIIRFGVFFVLMFFLSFIRIKFWYSLGYFYTLGLFFYYSTLIFLA